MAKTIFNMVNRIITPCNAARSWHWWVTEPCSVAYGSGIMTVHSPSGSNVIHGCGMTGRWIRPVAAPCNVASALGWHAMEFAQMSAIEFQFYIWFWFWPYHRSRHVILHQSVKFYPNRTTLSTKKWHHVDFQDGRSPPSWILGVQ